jgi:hypothetical protein
LNGFSRESEERKKNSRTGKKKKIEKIWFSQENAAENILQGGYRMCSDTMLGNMASMDIERKAWKTIVLMIVEMIQEWKKIGTNESIMWLI